VSHPASDRLAQLVIAQATSAEDLAAVHAIRFEVFCDEQQVPRSIELEHEAESTHYLARTEGVPCATARWRTTGADAAEDYKIKIERCAVLRPYRGLGLGHRLVQHLIDHLPAEHRQRPIYLHAQVHAEAFYQRLHFVTQGERYLEAGIEHVTMFYRP